MSRLLTFETNSVSDFQFLARLSNRLAAAIRFVFASSATMVGLRAPPLVYHGRPSIEMLAGGNWRPALVASPICQTGGVVPRLVANRASSPAQILARPDIAATTRFA